MRKIQADYIFPIHSEPIANGIVIIDEMGKILEVAPPQTYSDTEKYKGILCPNFVNTHCHLELSYLKNIIPTGTGLVNFIKPILKIRNDFSAETMATAIAAAEKEMLQNGIAAIGDISNDTTSFAQKAKGNLRYHTFIELLEFKANEAETAMQAGIAVLEKVPTAARSTASLSPHAPYTVSGSLLEKIAVFNNAKKHGIVSIHNQECAAENEFFQTGKGDFYDFYEGLNFDSKKYFRPTQTNSLNYTLKHLSKQHKLLLVHNTFSTTKDIQLAHAYSKNVYWCFCPNANLYIENRLPNFDAFIQENAKITIGTDSLTSNWQLCILSELKTISKAAPHILLADLLRWATLNGAELLDFEEDLGSFEVGKHAGINLIENVDIENLKLSENSKVRRLI
ncbi:MAG: amidohydrolase family protein [Chitinophagales bacterium]